MSLKQAFVAAGVLIGMSASFSHAAPTLIGQESDGNWSPAPGAEVTNISTQLAPPSTVIGITTAATTGATMTGMLVTTRYASGATSSGIWAPTGTSSGAASGTNGGATWNITESGNTFGGDWILTYAGADLMTGFTLDGFGFALSGQPGTIFDRSASPSNSNSQGGIDLSVNTSVPFDVNVLYRSNVTEMGFPTTPDLFRYIDVNFSASGIGATGVSTFSFDQDSDNVLAVQDVPEPTTLAALSAAGLLLRRRR